MNDNKNNVRFMWVILILMAFLAVMSLTGCATNPQIVAIPKVQPSIAIMEDCGTMQKLSDGTYQEAVNLLVVNANKFYECKKLNKAKKDFIINNSK